MINALPPYPATPAELADALERAGLGAAERSADALVFDPADLAGFQTWYATVEYRPADDAAPYLVEWFEVPAPHRFVSARFARVDDAAHLLRALPRSVDLTVGSTTNDLAVDTRELVLLRLDELLGTPDEPGPYRPRMAAP